MDQAGAEVDETISEPEAAGLPMAPSPVVTPPRVVLSPVALECRYCQTAVLAGAGGKTTDNSVVVGEVVNISIDDRVIAHGMPDVRRMRSVARLGCMDYCVVDDVFTMQRV
jgi:flavin reductase (DIM6/NTAB) family NADH-FMN oxidoreductase RutF